MKLQVMKCNTCMKAIEIKNIETHTKSHHFKEKIVVQKSLSLNKLSEGLLRNHPSSKKQIKIVSNKGTTFYFINYPSKKGLFNQSSTVKNLAEIQPPVELVCNTCKREMDSETCRILIARNVAGEPRFFSFHFFAPCWNIDDFTQKHPHLILDRIGFSILENQSISENGIKDLQRNLSYWVDSTHE